jgi:hypothetical protein
MFMTSRKRRSELFGKALDILIEQPHGLAAPAVFQLINERDALTEEELTTKPSRSLRRFEELVWLSTVAPAKAGWLRNDPECWMFTDEGKRKFQALGNAEEFISRAAAQSAKGWLSVQFPEVYSFLGKTAERLKIEFKLLRRVGVRELLARTFGLAPSWEEVLPVQAPQRYVVPGVTWDDSSALLSYLNATGANFAQGGHAIYLPPETLKQTVFSVLADNYPENAGLKIVNTPGGLENGHYVRNGYGNGPGQSKLQKNLIYDHQRLTLVANLLSSHGVGPRLYDLVELECNGSQWVGYVIEHVSGRTPSLNKCNEALSQMRAMEESGLIRNNMPDGWEDEDFRGPACNGNALLDDAGQVRYVDFQNFILTGYEKFLRQLALEATEKSHFGETTVLRGGRRYLYQSVPGVALPAKRNPEQRMKVVLELMKDAGVSMERRLVLDVGCNIGGMMAQYLKLGARWCHGWDRDYLTPHTEKLVLALGCTRFSMTGGDIDRDTDLTNLPDFLRPSLDGCVISYLAVRGHVGWLNALGKIPWSFLIYEAHEGESRADFDRHLRELSEIVGIRVAAATTYTDGDSDERLVAILMRTTTR